MKRLKVDIDDIAFVMESKDVIEESLTCLDTDTGEVINILASVMEDMEAGNEEAINDYPEWMKEMVEVAEAVLSDNIGRFQEIPKIPSHESYRIMERFISSIADERIRNRLLGAIRGKGSFRRFKDTVREWPEIEKRWHSFKDKAMRKEVLDWLESIGIKPE